VNDNVSPAPAGVVENPADFDGNGACTVNDGDPGWCYVSGKAASGCPQAILFTLDEPPHGAVVHLQCIEQAPSVGGF